MTDHTAKIRGKGCENTGLDEDLARQMHGNVGKFYMAIVELQVVTKHGPDLEGKRGVDLVITQLEPAGIGSKLDTHLRELTRSAYLERGDSGQPSLTSQSDVEPTVEELVAAGKRHEPHEFVPTTEGDTTICDVCGEDEDDKRHGDVDAARPVTEPDQEKTKGTPVTEPADETPKGTPVTEPAAEEPSNVVGFSSRS